MLDVLAVFLTAIAAGGLAIPLGVVLDLDPLTVYIAAVAGALAWWTPVLLLGGTARDALVRRFVPDAEDRIENGRARQILDRWGTPGLAFIGGLVLGPTITVAAALLLGVDRGKFLLWWYLATFLGFALFTLFWFAVLD